MFALAALIALQVGGGTATIRGVTTAAHDSTRLRGVEVVVSPIGSPERTVTATSDDEGRFELKGLDPSSYRLVARLAGFDELVREPVTLAAAQALDLNLALAVAGVSEKVTVGGQPGGASGGSSSEWMNGRMIDLLPVAGDDYRALLPILPGVVRGPDGRLTFKGGAETQAALQVGRGYANDPSTGTFGVELPADSISSVEVSPNPYAAADGRFSTSVVKIDTRPAGDRWRAVANGFIPVPCLRICDGESLGVRVYRPRGWVGGPLRAERLYLSQGLQYRYAKARVEDLPKGARDIRDRGMESFTRLDARFSPGHVLTSSVALFPRRASNIGLSPLVPMEATQVAQLFGSSVTVSESSALGRSAFLQSSVTANRYDVDVSGRSDRPAELTVAGARENFFNRQERRTRAAQWTETLTRGMSGGAGDHVLTAGVDLLWSRYRATSRSVPVIVRRADGTVAERLDFDGPSAQDQRGLDVAAFVQDRWSLSPRLLVEPGLRVERDGVTSRTHASPRMGLVIGLAGDGDTVLRGGAGVFLERTPLNVGAFESFEAATVSRFGPDGLSQIGAPVAYVHDARELRTPRSVVWNIELDQRVTAGTFLKINHLQRTSRHLAVLEPTEDGTGGALVLESRGRARYRETEVTMRLGRTEQRQASVAYVRSHARSHLNLYDLYFGNFRHPIVRTDEYTLAPADAPNRLLVRGITPFREKWMLSALLEVRDGFPYSAIDERQRFVGSRNHAGRFPPLRTLDVSAIRRVTLRGRAVQIGVRVYHVLDTFHPRDVQNNIASPAFGTFYNSIYRRYSGTFSLATD